MIAINLPELRVPVVVGIIGDGDLSFAFGPYFFSDGCLAIGIYCTRVLNNNKKKTSRTLVPEFGAGCKKSDGSEGFVEYPSLTRYVELYFFLILAAFRCPTGNVAGDVLLTLSGGASIRAMGSRTSISRETPLSSSASLRSGDIPFSPPNITYNLLNLRYRRRSRFRFTSAHPG